MVKDKDLDGLSSDELLALNQQEMADRAADDERHKTRQQAIMRALSVSVAREKLERDLEDYDPETRAAVLAGMAKEG